MLSISDAGSLARALKLPIDLRLKRLLTERRDQLGGGALFCLGAETDRKPSRQPAHLLASPVGGCNET